MVENEIIGKVIEKIINLAELEGIKGRQLNFDGLEEFLNKNWGHRHNIEDFNQIELTYHKGKLTGIEISYGFPGVNVNTWGSETKYNSFTVYEKE